MREFKIPESLKKKLSDSLAGITIVQGPHDHRVSNSRSTHEPPYGLWDFGNGIEKIHLPECDRKHDLADSNCNSFGRK